MSNKERRKAPVLRFKGFTDDWEQRKFSDIAQRISTNININLPNVTYDDIDSENETLNKGIKNLSSGKKGILFQKNDILFGKLRPYLNNIIKVDFKGIAVGDFWVLRAYEDSSFLFSLINTPQYKYIANISSGSKMPRSDWNLVSKYLFCIPSEKEQSHIGNLILKLSQQITLQQRKLDILKQLKKTYLSEMYCIKKLQNPKLRFLGFSTNWKKYQIKQLGKVITGSTPSTKHSEYYNNKDGIPWVTPTDIHQNITYSSARKISKKGQKIARIVPQNTILVTCIASIGKNTILGQMGSFNQQINGLIPDFKKYDLYFLFTQTEFWSLKMKQLASAGTMQIVNKKEFENIETFISNLNEQQKIGSLFLQLDNCVSDAQKKITSFKQIKNFLLQNMFI